jgi:hypothetical protein
MNYFENRMVIGLVSFTGACKNLLTVTCKVFIMELVVKET